MSCRGILCWVQLSVLSFSRPHSNSVCDIPLLLRASPDTAVKAPVDKTNWISPRKADLFVTSAPPAGPDNLSPCEPSSLAALFCVACIGCVLRNCDWLQTACVLLARRAAVLTHPCFLLYWCCVCLCVCMPGCRSGTSHTESSPSKTTLPPAQVSVHPCQL